ncbi:NHLP bacteriocin system secretion protein [Chlorobium phaeovibrioides]|uniref:NHLP bacteriocin system secretion protein n=1 Tax=Chlorobium phaeovibrioides TaxID=1094 RepID=A0A3S0NBZ3_CHLPH|nr:NHLP bacteriocin system secretion protein [Chlorobium phaeovibrioides]RTY39978.1 NHLP bacteriocin system secretion protein [Chlorobium phaeovibrioides]
MALEFRKQALDKLTSPEDLDRIMKVTDARGWIAMGTIGLLLFAVVIWAFTGLVPTVVSGSGILMKGDIVILDAKADGRVNMIANQQGLVLKSGTLVATVDQPALNQELSSARDAYNGVMTHYKTRVALLKKRLQLQESRLSGLKGLFDRGLVDRPMMAGAEGDFINAQNELYALELMMSNARDRYEDAKAAYEWETSVTMPYDGRIIDIDADDASLVAKGTPLFHVEKLQPDSAGVHVVLYVPSGLAKKIREGMAAMVSPATVKAEEYGHIIGSVVSVSEYPESVSALKAKLGNDMLVSTLSRNGAPYEVLVRLQKDDESPSGYRWTSGRGPDVKITQGAFCTGSVSVEELPPAAYVLPVIKKMVLGSDQ